MQCYCCNVINCCGLFVMSCLSVTITSYYLCLWCPMIWQEEHNRDKPNWEHLKEDLHVLLTVEDTENRAKIKLARAVEEVKKLLVPAVSIPSVLQEIVVRSLVWLRAREKCVLSLTFGNTLYRLHGRAVRNIRITYLFTRV